MTTWQDMERKYYMFVVRRQPVVIVRGQGTRVWDENAKEYLDFTAGWAVNCLGHCHPAVVDAIRSQAATLLQTSNQFYTIPQLQLAQALVDNSCLDRAFFSNSGAEANEGAVKLARKYGKLHRNGAYEVITAMNSFHGRTLAMVAATGQPHYQENWKPLAEGFVNVEYSDLEAVKRATTAKTCAVMVEPVQGEGGVIIPQEGYLKALRDWCDQNNLLLIFDEVQTGVGRLGTLWGYQSFGVEPDVMTLAKGMGGGVPIGAFLAKERCAVLEPGDHGSTFGGNPLTTAAANATVRYVIEHDIPARAKDMGDYLRRGLEALQAKHSFISQVRGMGLLVALQFNSEVSGKVVAACNEEGLLLNAVRPNAIRFMPPLTISRQEIDEGLERLERGMLKAVA
ncbi:MAG: aspartate aminotransferase family protein [Chloroflexi bacterium]|nr:aspartate aminotransferase family protein [Chloroflexota bacterium]